MAVTLLVGSILPLVNASLASAVDPLVSEFSSPTRITGKNKGYSGDNLSFQTVASSNDGSVLIATLASDGAYYLSTNAGSTWEIHTLDDSSNIAKIQFGADSDTIVALGTDSNYIPALYISTDTGLTWTKQSIQPNDFAFSNDGSTIAATSGTSIFMSYTLGETWTEYTFEEDVSQFQYITASSNGEHIFVIASDLSYEVTTLASSDNGLHWTLLPQESLPSYAYGLTSSNDGTRVITHDGSTLFISQDYGATWTPKTIEGVDTFGAVTIAANNTLMTVGIGPLYSSIDWGETWTQHSLEGKIIDYFSIYNNSAGILAIAQGSLYTSDDSGTTWHQYTLEGNRNWQAVATSADGQKLIASDVYNGVVGIYKSVNSGSTWTQVASIEGINSWSLMRSSANGDRLVAFGGTSYGYGYVFISTDSGETWQQQQVDGTDTAIRWGEALSMSQDGLTIITASQNQFYGTQDGGTTWEEFILPATRNPIGGAAVSDNGTYIAVVAYTTNTEDWSTSYYLEISDDNGASWSESPIANISEPTDIFISNDGNTVVISATTDSQKSILRSTNSGATWEYVSLPGSTHEWGSDLISIANGTLFGINAALYDAELDSYVRSFYVSNDYGQTWTPQFSNLPYELSHLAFANEGTVVYIVATDGYIYKSSSSDETPLSPSIGFNPEVSNSPSTPTSTDSNAPQPITNTQPTFSGVAAPFATITVTVHSDPIVCSTTADADGNWSCTLPSTIPPGVHTILVEVTDPDTEEVTTIGPYYIQVAGSGSNTITDTTPLAPNTGVTPAFTLASPTQKSAPQNALHTASAAVQTSEVIAALVIIAALIWLGRATSLYSKQRQQ